MTDFRALISLLAKSDDGDGQGNACDLDCTSTSNPKAILLPSGENDGSISNAVLLVRRIGFEPSAFITYISNAPSRSEEKAIFLGYSARRRPNLPALLYCAPNLPLYSPDVMKALTISARFTRLSATTSLRTSSPGWLNSFNFVSQKL